MTMQDTYCANAPYYQPDMVELERLSRAARPVSARIAHEWLNRKGQPLDFSQVASLIKTVLQGRDSELNELVKEHARALRRELFGSAIVPMAPIEISNSCASDCLFCGWRSSNRAMKRLRMPYDLLMMQAEYLLDLGICHIEYVSGDEIGVVRDLMPRLLRGTRELFARRGVDGKVSFCSLALTARQYADLRQAGADTMIVWQESYNRQIFQQHILRGPKATGIDDEWRQVPDGDGFSFRVESQERAWRSGIEPALGSMLGLNPDITAEMLAVIDHARFLGQTFDASVDRPVIMGMPIWNPITTPQTDNRPDATPDLVELFPVLAALYLLALPHESTWVFPNCRVPLRIQIEAAQVAGVFSSTEVKLGPGGYLPSIVRQAASKGKNTKELRQRIAFLLREENDNVDELEMALDEREQFVHHYHAHEQYLAEMARVGLRVVSSAYLDASAREASVGR